MKNNIVLEKAKDENWTCKVNINGKWQYMYSKYNPIKKIDSISNSYSYIVLGIGLGYELEQIAENTNGVIYVIDKDKTFYDLVSKLKPLNQIINNPKIKFLFGDEYKTVNLKEMNNYKIYNNKNLTQINILYFSQVIKFLSSKKGNKRKIAFYEHITIADDSIEALKNLGYDVVKMAFSTKDRMIQDIMYVNPDYIFSINLSEKITEVSKVLSIPYVSWTVDTPSYSLYGNLLENKNLVAFIYDYHIVHEFVEKGLNNVFYMPVAANVKRLDGIDVNSNDLDKYSCDVSFLGSTDVANEFNKYIYDLLSEETYLNIKEIFRKQFLSGDKNIIKKLIDEDLITRIEHDTGYNITTQTYIDKKQKLAFLLGRKFNQLERINMIKNLSKIFNFHVYGDEYWSKLDCEYIQYKGYAEHFYEMPKVFRISKININYTRIYVDSGLPMRVFDVLGSKGFLVTNNKEDIGKYFVDGKDLVIYRDTKDLIEIIKYYLNNEKERQKIVLNGYERVKKHHTYEIRLSEMMNITNRYLKLR